MAVTLTLQGNTIIFDGSHTAAQARTLSVQEENHNTVYFTTDGHIFIQGTDFGKDCSVDIGSTNGTIKINGTDVAVKGLGSAAYVNTNTFATAVQGVKADSAVQSIVVNGSQLSKSNCVITLPNYPTKASLGLTNAVIAGSDGKVPTSALPSYVDDVVEVYMASGKAYKESGHTTEVTGEAGKIYVDMATNKTYRYSGSAFVEISASLALGTTSSTAFRGDYGNTAYQHAAAKGSAFAAGLYKITINAQGHVTAAVAVAKGDITALGIPETNTTYQEVNLTNGSTVGSTPGVVKYETLAELNTKATEAQSMASQLFSVTNGHSRMFVDLLNRVTALENAMKWK